MNTMKKEYDRDELPEKDLGLIIIDEDLLTQERIRIEKLQDLVKKIENIIDTEHQQTH